MADATPQTHVNTEMCLETRLRQWTSSLLYWYFSDWTGKEQLEAMRKLVSSSKYQHDHFTKLFSAVTGGNLN